MSHLTALRDLIRSTSPHLREATEIREADSLQEHLGFDSHGLLALALGLEREFGLDVAKHADELSEVKTVGDVLRIIEAYASPVAERRAVGAQNVENVP